MRKICAWCKKELGSSHADDGTGNTPITHGICSDCVREALMFKAKTLKSFLDLFSEPVFYVDSEARVVASNNAGYSLLNKDPREVNGKLGGVAFDCSYAALPGGCGKTVHCKTCTIRNTVTDTLRTGKSNVNVPAYPDLHHVTGECKICFLISTERVGDAVLLRIDDVIEGAKT